MTAFPEAMTNSSLHDAGTPPRIVGASAKARHLLRHEVFPTIESAESIRDDWTALLKATGGDVFGSFEWCATWWKHFSKGRRLEIHAFSLDSELVAVFPLFREILRCGPLKLRVVRFLGSDHAGTRCWPIFRLESIREVASLLLAELGCSEPWDLLQIGDLPGYFPHVTELAAAFSECGASKAFLRQAYYPHAVFTLPDDFEKYLEQLSGNERNNIRKNERRLSKTHALTTTLVTGTERDACLDDFFRWHDDYWKEQNQLGFFTLWPGSREFHTDMIHAGEGAVQPLLFRLHANDEPVGLVYAHRFNSRLHLFQAVRAPGTTFESYGPGRLLHCEVFRWCMSEGISVVDAMSGFYEYKRRLGAQFPGLSTLTVVHSSRASQRRARHFRWIVAAVDTIYFRLWLSRITPMLRTRFRIAHVGFLRAGMARWFIRARFLMAVFDIATQTAASGFENLQDA